MINRGLDIFRSVLILGLFGTAVLIGFLLSPILGVWALLWKGKNPFEWTIFLFLRLFWGFIAFLCPKITFQVKGKKKIHELRGAVVISNHLSFLDALFLLSIKRHMVPLIKGDYFRIPLLGYYLKLAGFIPTPSVRQTDALYTERIAKLHKELNKGKCLLSFPEGTRSKNGVLGKFKTGTFKLAKRFQAPVELLCIQNTDRLFPPGSMTFSTCQSLTIQVEYLGEIDLNQAANDMKQEAQARYETYMDTAKDITSTQQKQERQ